MPEQQITEAEKDAVEEQVQAAIEAELAKKGITGAEAEAFADAKAAEIMDQLVPDAQLAGNLTAEQAFAGKACDLLGGWNPSTTRNKFPKELFESFFTEANAKLAKTKGSIKHRVLVSGKMADALDKDNLRYAQLYAEFAFASYRGFNAECEKVDKLDVKKLPLSDPLPKKESGKEDTLYGEKSVILKELEHSTVLMSNQILDKDTDTEIWVCCYKRNPDYTQGFHNHQLVKSHISDDEPIRVVVAARGTDGMDDAITDVKFNLTDKLQTKQGTKEDFKTRYQSYPKCADLPLNKIKVHSGFSEQVDAVRDEIDKEILQMMKDHYNAKQDPDLTLHQLLDKHPLLFTFVGHSMGGALTRMLCFDFLCRNVAKGEGWTRLVTIGSAPTGNEEFADSLDKLLGEEEDPMRSLHVVNNNDPIPHSLDRWWTKYVTGKYEHCGMLVWLGEGGEMLKGKPGIQVCKCCCHHYSAGMDHCEAPTMEALKRAWKLEEADDAFSL